MWGTLLTAITASKKEDSIGGEEGARLPGKGAAEYRACVCVCVCAHACERACKNACVFMPVSDTCKKGSKISILRTTNAMGHRWHSITDWWKGREAWLAAVRGVTKSWTWLNSWTTASHGQVGITTQWLTKSSERGETDLTIHRMARLEWLF